MPKYQHQIHDKGIYCYKITKYYSYSNNIDAEAGKLKEVFNSDYISSQINLMLKMQGENPTEAIGKSKELIESCCKTILELEGCAIEKNGI